MTDTVTQMSPEGHHSRNRGEEGLAPLGVGRERRGDQEATKKQSHWTAVLLRVLHLYLLYSHPHWVEFENGHLF